MSLDPRKMLGLAAGIGVLGGVLLFLMQGQSSRSLSVGEPSAQVPREVPVVESSPADRKRASFSVSSPVTTTNAVRVMPRPSGMRDASRSPGEPLGGNLVEFDVVDGDLAVAFGDVILGKADAGNRGRRGVFEVPTLRFWPSPEIPYIINPDLPDPSRVEKAIEYYRQNTPVRFVPWQGQKDAIVFQPGSEHCYSVLGQQGGLQPLQLSPGCGPGEIIHELMHALGFVHEQMRSDRDHYVQILWDQLDEKFYPQYVIVPDSLQEAIQGFPFDFRSVMLYRQDEFARVPGTVVMKSRDGRAIDPVTQGLSEGDIARLKRMFRSGE